MKRGRGSAAVDVPVLEPMGLEDRVRELLDAVLTAAETSQIRGDDLHSRELLEGAFQRRLDLAALAPFPLTATRAEAAMAYAVALSLARTVLASVSVSGGSLTDAVRLLVEGAKP